MQIFCEFPRRWQETGDPGRKSARWAKVRNCSTVCEYRWCEGYGIWYSPGYCIS